MKVVQQLQSLLSQYCLQLGWQWSANQLASFEGCLQLPTGLTTKWGVKWLLILPFPVLVAANAAAASSPWDTAGDNAK